MNFNHLVLGLLALFFTSCASIMHGPYQVVDFTSQPHGATVTIDGVDYGQTPQAVELKRNGRMKGDPAGKKMYNVAITLDGYYPHEMKIKREMDAWLLGNVIFGGLFGIIIDAGSGSMYKLTPDQVIAQMNRDGKAMIESENDHLYVAVTLKVNPEWEKIGQLDKVE